MKFDDVTCIALYISAVTACMWGILGLASFQQLHFVVYGMFVVLAAGYTVVAGFYRFDESRLPDQLPLSHTVALPILYGAAFAALSAAHNLFMAGVSDQTILVGSAVSNFGFVAGFAAIAVFSTVADTSSTYEENTESSEGGEDR